MARFSPHLLCLRLVSLVVTGLFSGILAAAELVPHRATYLLQLNQANPTGRYSAVRGRTTTSLERTCEGWITAEDVGMVVSTRIGGEIIQHLRFTGWESANGLEYRFVSRSRFGAEQLNVSAPSGVRPISSAKCAYSTVDNPNPLSLSVSQKFHKPSDLAFDFSPSRISV